MKNNILLLGFVLVILASMSLVCFSETTQLILVGGQLGGGSQLTATAVSEVVHRMYPEIAIDVRPGSGVSNIMNVSKGNADMGIAVSIASKASTLGIEPFKEKIPGVLAIASTTTSVTQIITLEKTGINSIRQIIDEKIPIKISVGEVGSNTEYGFRKIMEAYGITYDDITSWGGKYYFKEAAEANDMMSAGLLDIQIAGGPAPKSRFLQLSVTHALKMLSIDEEVVETLSKKYGYSKHYVTNEDYDFVKTDTPTVAALSNIIVREDISEEIVYKITKAIGDNLDYFRNVSFTWNSITQDSMALGSGLNLHPGAMRYYQEIGVLK